MIFIAILNEIYQYYIDISQPTDIYIKKDFTAINEANRKVIDFVIGSEIGRASCRERV